MKVLLIQDSLMPLGGAEIIVAQTAEALVGVGCFPLIACGQRCPTFSPNIPVYEVPELLQPSGKAAFNALETIMDLEQPDLIHIHKVPSPEVIQLAAERLPTIVTVHDHSAYCPGGSKVFWRMEALCTRPLGLPCLIHAYTHHCAARNPLRLRRQFTFSMQTLPALRRAHCVLTLSGYVREQLLRHGLEPERVNVLPPWFEVSSEVTPNRGETVLFAGRLAREKGISVLLRALAQLQVPFKAVIAGNGPQRASSEKLASELGLEERVRFLGWLPKAVLRRKFAGCTLLVLPSLWPEPFGLVGPEAMAYGKPVVAFDVGGVRDWLVDRVNGFLVPRGERRELAAAIARLLNDSDLQTRMGHAARNFVMERFDRKVLLGRLLEIYHEVLTA